MIGGNNRDVCITVRSDIRGYTLVEMIVTVGIFSLAFTAIAAIFIGFTTAQSRASTSQRLLNDGNYLLETIAREIRMSAIDYECAGYDPAFVESAICLRSPEGEYIRFQFVDRSGVNDLEVCKAFSASACPIGGAGGGWVSLRPDAVELASVRFRTYPHDDPFSFPVADDDAWHPVTTIQIRIASGRARARVTYDLQTAVSSRVYGF